MEEKGPVFECYLLYVCVAYFVSNDYSIVVDSRDFFLQMLIGRLREGNDSTE
jgi:hypothetical protein